MLLLSLLGFAALGGRLFYLQILQHQRFSQLAQAQRTRPTTIDPRRGNIYDSNHTILAMSVGAEAVYAVPHPARNDAEAAEDLSAVTALTTAELLELFASLETSTWLDRSLDWEQAQAIRHLNIPGIRLIERPQRYYPQGVLGSHVLGFSGIDNQGLEGLEYQYDELLRGSPGTWTQEWDATQRRIPTQPGVINPPEHGDELVLAMDAKVQYMAETELEQAVEASGSDRGIILLMDSKTGGIVANAIYPSFDPNRYQDYGSHVRRNIGVADQFEPGSTLKVLTAAAGLDLEAVDFDTVFSSGSSWQVGGGRVRNWNRRMPEEQTFVETMETSDNIAFAKLAVDLGPSRFYPYLRDFGIGDRLGIDFPGETSGRLPAPGEIQFGETLQWANIGFGQGVAMSPLQLLCAVNAIANRGELLRPYYVQEIRDSEGNLKHSTEPEVLAAPISPETAAKTSYLMRSAVLNGTGSQADIPGYPVAGKTGTAEVPVSGGYGDDRIASFVGFAPLDNPRLTGIVVLFNPKADNRYGGVLAAPVFSTVMEKALDQLGVDAISDVETPSEPHIPNVRSRPLLEAQVLLAEEGLTWSYQGSGEYVVDQRPAPGVRTHADAVVALQFFPKLTPEMVEVPSLDGLSMREALGRAEALNLHLDAQGSGFLVKQEPEAGSHVEAGSVIRAMFRQKWE